MVVKIIRIVCDNCGRTKSKSAREIRKHRFHFCNKRCYWEFRRKNEFFDTTKGLKYDCSQLKTIEDMAKKSKRDFEIVSYW
jgi:hypothetical protein